MSATYRFEAEARTEYLDAIRYYATEAGDAQVAAHFIAAVDSAVAVICAAPAMWRMAEPPDVRRYVIRHFPFVFYYRYQAAENLVIVYALVHTSRRPGFWRGRLPPSL